MSVDGVSFKLVRVSSFCANQNRFIVWLLSFFPVLYSAERAPSITSRVEHCSSPSLRALHSQLRIFRLVCLPQPELNPSTMWLTACQFSWHKNTSSIRLSVNLRQWKDTLRVFLNIITLVTVRGGIRFKPIQVFTMHPPYSVEILETPQSLILGFNLWSIESFPPILIVITAFSQ